MLTHTTLFETKLKELLEAHIVALSLQLAGGNAASFEEFKYKSGVIQGLKDAIEFMTEAETQLQKQ